MSLLILCIYLLLKNTLYFEKDVLSISNLSHEELNELIRIKNNFNKYRQLKYLTSDHVSTHDKLKKIRMSNDEIYSCNLLSGGLKNEINDFLINQNETELI